MKIRGTDFVLFEVTDLSKAAQFYRETLGLAQEVYAEEAEGGWAEFNCGNVTLSLNPGAEIAGGKGGGIIALAVDDVQAAYVELKGKGARIVGEPVDYGVCKAFQVRDPDGNHVIIHRRADGTFGQETPEG